MSIDPVLANSRRQVYFARVGRHLKVGCSLNPTKRVQRIRTDDCVKPADLDRTAPVEIIRTIPGGYAREAELQIALADFYVAGEWFAAEPEVVDYVMGLDATRQAPYLHRAAGPLYAADEAASDPHLGDALAGMFAS